MAQPPKRRPKRAPEPLDWRELANGPALRGLSDVLATPAAVSRERAERRRAVDQDQTPTDDHTPTVVESPTVGVSPAAQETTTVGEKPTVVQKPTVFETTTVGAIAVQHARQSLTLGEDRFHEMAWNAAGPEEPGGGRILSMGYDRLARLVGLDEKSVRQLIPRLAAKQVLEIVAPENCATRQGKTYRIFSFDQILERQRRAGLTHIVKRGRAVEFLPPTRGKE